MADVHEQQHKDSNAENKVSMTNEKTLRDGFKEVKDMAKRYMTKAKISKSEREAFESKIESLEKALKSEKEANERILKNERKMAKLTHEAYTAILGEDARSMGHSPTRLNKQEEDFAKMADAYEQGESSSGLRGAIGNFIATAKWLVGNDEVSKSEKEASIDKELDKEFFWHQEETRERAVEGGEVVFNDSVKRFLDFTRGVMYHKMFLDRETVRAKMRDIEKVMASCSGLPQSIQLYSRMLDEKKDSNLYMTEAELDLPGSVEEEFA
ncbi:hypothetical protein J3E69DRAFT_379680 [Trichoderma sp. SZMC 28015]